MNEVQIIENEPEICAECESEIQTLDGFTSCDCPDSGLSDPDNYCRRCERRAVDCFCQQGFARDERDLY